MKAFRKTIMAFALLLTGGLASFAGTVLPLPSASGPTLGDPTTNIYSMMQQLQNNTTSNFFSFTTVTVFAGPLTATQMQYGYNLLTAATGATTSVVLPQAKPGADIVVVNNTNQGIQVFGAVPTSTLPGQGAGGFDFINGTNGTFGTTPYVNTTLTTVTRVINCYAPVLGNWWCISGL